MNIRDYDSIFITGPQGSGKGTQARILAEKTGAFHWDMGQILRDQKDRKTITGETVREITDDGGFLTTEQIIGIVEEKLATLPKDKKIIFDGLPRRISQAKFLLEILKKRDQDKFLIIDISLPREISLERLRLRAEKEGRADDTEEAINKRLDFYDETIVPTVEYLKGFADYVEIDGMPSIEKVAEDIAGKLEIKE